MVTWYMNWIPTSKLQSKCILHMKTTWKHRIFYLPKYRCFSLIFFHSLALYWAKQIPNHILDECFWLTNLQLNSWSKDQVISKGNFGGLSAYLPKSERIFKRIYYLASKRGLIKKSKARKFLFEITSPIGITAKVQVLEPLQKLLLPTIFSQ